MRDNLPSPNGFTVTELLVVIAVIVILAALLLPVLGSTKTRAQRAVCMNNLHQINLGVRMYSDDANDSAPSLGRGQPVWFRYRQLLQAYFGLSGPPSPADKVFACPSDTFYYKLYRKSVELVAQGHYAQSNYAYSSYEFNGANQATNAAIKYWGLNSLPGISGYKLSSIRHPASTVLVAEAAAYWPYSWHQPKPPQAAKAPLNFIPMFNNAANVVSFVDGHVGYLKMYWDSSTNANGLYTLAFLYNPPPQYGYQWSPD